MLTVKEIVDCLRCSSKPGGACSIEGCRYKVYEEARSDIPVPPDAIIDGKGYWVSCDPDRIMQDAAKALERVFTC